MMKNFKYILAVLVLSMGIYSCEDNILETNIDPVNKNSPTINSTVTSVTGMTTMGRGVYTKVIDGFGVYMWFTYGYHETMGDNLTMPWGNFGGRWMNQTESVTLDDGTVVFPPSGGTQPEEVNIRNTRAQGSNNATSHEWRAMYAVNNHANIMLENLEKLEDATPSQTDAFKAWAFWWKAYAYSRLGSMYEEGIINDISFETNSNFVSNTALIAESNRLLSELESIINGTASVAEFDTVLNNLQLSDLNTTIGKAALLENINTLRTRNLVYNTKTNNMTSADWNQVISWSDNGVSDNKNAFIMRSNPDLVNNNWLPSRVTGFWYFPSPRLIQDINPGDARFDAYFRPFVFPNPRGRGIQYGMTHFWSKSPSAIVDNAANTIAMYYAGSLEENELFLAEAKIRTGLIEEGLAHLDAVRTLQSSGLDATVGTLLTEAEALEEIRKERRLGLIMRSVAFYDARRNGVSSGSRTGAVVVDAAGNINTNATIKYGYLDYWPAPENETDFNFSPSTQN